MSFSVWLISLRIVSCRFIHAAAGVRISFLSEAETPSLRSKMICYTTLTALYSLLLLSRHYPLLEKALAWEHKARVLCVGGPQDHPQTRRLTRKADRHRISLPPSSGSLQRRTQSKTSKGKRQMGQKPGEARRRLPRVPSLKSPRTRSLLPKRVVTTHAKCRLPGKSPGD